MLVFTVSFLFPFFLTYIDVISAWRTAPKWAAESIGSQNNESLQNR